MLEELNPYTKNYFMALRDDSSVTYIEYLKNVLKFSYLFILILNCAYNFVQNYIHQRILSKFWFLHVQILSIDIKFCLL